MQINSWLLRSLRRFAVVFVSGGILAISEELKLIQAGATPETLLYISAAIGLLTAIEKALRDHKNTIVKT
jgi:preprotein translocase subunit Sec61beta